MAFEKLGSFFGINDEDDFDEKKPEAAEPKQENYANNEKVVSMSTASEARTRPTVKLLFTNLGFTQMRKLSLNNF